MNNRGCVVESAIHDGPYNYIKHWDYAGLIDARNAEDGHGLGLTATTGKELSDAITRARKHQGGPVLIECQIAHDDTGPRLLEWGSKVEHANDRPHQQTWDRVSHPGVTRPLRAWSRAASIASCYPLTGRILDATK